MASLKTVKEVVEALETRYSGPTQDKDGFTYIAWPEVVRQLNAIFGPTFWSSEPVSFTANPEHGIYTAAIKLSATAVDEETGMVVEFTRSGFSTSVAQATRDEKKEGLTISRDPRTHETAADGAGSLALVKATKQLGDAFGLFLYNKGEQRSQPSSYSRPIPSAGTASATAPTGEYVGGVYNVPARDKLSDKQLFHLKKRHSDTEIDAMTFGEAKAKLDAILGGGSKAPVAAGAAVKSAPAVTQSIDDLFND
jgi:hypothetical protein